MYTNKNSITFSLTEPIQQFFQAFFLKTPVSAFAFSRVFPDGSRGTLSSSLELVDLMFLKNNYLESINTIKLFKGFQQRYTFSPTFRAHFPSAEEHLFYQKVIEEREQLLLDNMFGVFVNQKKHVDIFCFYTQPGSCYENYFINHIATIEQFIDAFTQQQSELIEKACKDRVLIQDHKGFSTRLPQLLLSKREQECLYWCMIGKTNSEIAMILSISSETVNTYFKQIFKKLNVTTRVQAVVKALQLGGISAFHQ